MIYIVLGTDALLRTKAKEALFKKIGTATHIIDDSVMDVSALETYAYPSLFSTTPQLIVASFLLEPAETIDKKLIATLVASPNIFVLVERTMKTDRKKLFEAQGASVIVSDLPVKKSSPPALFTTVASICTLPSARERWLQYQSVIEKEPAEAIVGIMYWKLRDLIQKVPAKRPFYTAFYRDLISAHAQSWQQGTSLSIAVEKVLLTR